MCKVTHFYLQQNTCVVFEMCKVICVVFEMCKVICVVFKMCKVICVVFEMCKVICVVFEMCKVTCFYWQWKCVLFEIRKSFVFYLKCVKASHNISIAIRNAWLYTLRIEHISIANRNTWLHKPNVIEYTYILYDALKYPLKSTRIWVLFKGYLKRLVQPILETANKTVLWRISIDTVEGKKIEKNYQPLSLWAA